MFSAYETSGTSPAHAGDRADFRIENHGSIFLVVPLTEAAQSWIEENVSQDGFLALLADRSS